MIMKKDVQLKFALLLMLFVASFAACDDDDEKIDAGSPDFTFNSETGEYNVRIGKEVALCARVKDAVNPVYTWKREGKIVADGKSDDFTELELGMLMLTGRLEKEGVKHE